MHTSRPRSRALLTIIAPLLILSLACGGGSSSKSAVSSDAAETALAAEYATAEHEIATLVAAGNERLAVRDLASAAGSIKDAQTVIDPFRSKLGEGRVQKSTESIAALKSEYERVVAVQQGVALAKEVVADKERCNTIKSVSEAWTGITQVTKTDPKRPSAVTLSKQLEKCRVGIQRDLAKVTADYMILQRQSMPSTMERVFLDSGMDVRISVRGRAKDEIRFTWVLMSRVTVHQLTGGGSMAAGTFLRNLQDVGFKKVVFADGYNESFTYTLEPQKIEEAAAEALAKQGLGSALALAE